MTYDDCDKSILLLIGLVIASISMIMLIMSIPTKTSKAITINENNQANISSTIETKKTNTNDEKSMPNISGFAIKIIAIIAIMMGVSILWVIIGYNLCAIILAWMIVSGYYDNLIQAGFAWENIIDMKHSLALSIKCAHFHNIQDLWDKIIYTGYISQMNKDLSKIDVHYNEPMYKSLARKIYTRIPITFDFNMKLLPTAFDIQDQIQSIASIPETDSYKDNEIIALMNLYKGEDNYTMKHIKSFYLG